jgi:hypothetical protein
MANTDQIIRFFDTMYIKLSPTPNTPVSAFDAAALSSMTQIIDLRAKAETNSDNASTVDMGNGTILVTSEKIEFKAQITLDKNAYETLRGFRNKRVNLILVDSEGEVNEDDALENCPALFGVMINANLKMTSNEDCLVDITATRTHSKLENFFKLATVTL